jgi:hypothetical protein
MNKMRKFFMFFLAVVLVGCAGWEIADNALSQALVRIVASNFGYFVATEHPDDNDSVKSVWAFMRSGTASPEDLGEFFAAWQKERPLLVMNMVNLLQTMGAVIADDAVNIMPIPDGLWNAAEEAYQTGWTMGLKGGEPIELNS